MKRYILGIAALILALGFSAFKTNSVSYMTYNPSGIALSQIITPASYNLSPQYCYGASAIPCKIDIAPYENAVEFTNFLKTLSPADAQVEFQSRATGSFKNPY